MFIHMSATLAPERVDVLLDAALAAFDPLGYGATPVPVIAQHAGVGVEINQFVRLQCHGGGFCHFFPQQVEDFPGGGKSQRRQQHQRAIVQLRADGLGVHFAHFAAVLVVDSLPVDIRHNSKIDRTALAAWAGAILAGRGAA